MEEATLLNRTPPIFSLDNYFAFDSTRLKLPININLMRGYFAPQGLVLFHCYGCDFFLIVNGLKDSLHQLFIGNARVFLLFSHYRGYEQLRLETKVGVNANPLSNPSTSAMAIVRQQPQPRNARTSKLRYMNAWIARRYRCKLSNAYIHGGVLENDILSPSSILSRGLSTVDGCSTA